MWKAVETKAEKVRMAETEERRKKERNRKETREKREDGKEKTKERKEDEGKKSSRRIEDLKWREKSSKVRERIKEVSSREIP